MTAKRIVIAHREALVAEALVTALGGFSHLAPVAFATSVAQAERQADKADAVVLDRLLPGSEDAAVRLRKRGRRVVMLGASRNDSGAVVSPAGSVAALAQALVPTSAPSQDVVKTLTPREREILWLVARGFAGKQVAKQLGISPKTVEQHKTRLFAKLGVSNQTAAACLCLSGSLDLRIPSMSEVRAHESA